MESLEQIQGMPPGMYHRYGVLDDDMEDEDDDNAVDHAGGFDALAAAGGAGGAAAGIYSADMLVAGMAGLGVSDPSEGDEAAAGAGAAGGDAAGGVAGDEGEAAGSSGAAGQGNWSLLSHPGERGMILGVDARLGVAGGVSVTLLVSCNWRSGQPED